MALGDPYASLVDLKAYLAATLQGSAKYDDSLNSALASTSAELERITNRQFNDAGEPTPRVYSPESPTWLAVDDFHTTDGLIIETGPGDGTFPTVLTAGEYQLEPLNGVVDGQTGWPYSKIRVPGGLACTRGGASVRVTARWGWAAVPAPVRQACLIIASETFVLKDAPHGIAGSTDFGAVLVRDNRVAAAKLARYMRHRVLVG